VPLAILVRREGQLALPIAVATLGNYLGACTTYLLARAAASRIVTAEGSRSQRAARLVQRYGSPALLLSWVPIVGDALVALAGASRMSFGPFSLWTLIGKAGRYLAVAWAADAL
jgi:membrane protein YqaA with SNARE-associated domain